MNENKQIEENIIKSKKEIKKLESYLKNRVVSYFYGKENIYDDIEEKYENLIQLYIIKKDYKSYYDTILDYNNILEEHYNKYYNTMIKKTQLNNIKKLIDMNIFTRFNKPDNNYYELITNYEKYAEDTGDADVYLKTIDHIIKLYSCNNELYCTDDDIIKFLNKYYNLKNIPHKEHGLILCKLGNYKEAINIYQKYIDEYINHNAMKYFVGNYIYMMMLCCMLSNDEVSTLSQYNRIKTDYPTVETNYEYKFIVQLVDAYLEKNVEKFVSILNEHDSMKRLDDIIINMLLKIKQQMIDIDDNIC